MVSEQIQVGQLTPIRVPRVASVKLRTLILGDPQVSKGFMN